MIENNSIDNNCEVMSNALIEILQPEETKKVSTITDLWVMAKMTKDFIGDPIWETLNQIGCNPRPFENLGFNFNFNGLTMIYFPARQKRNTIRFVIPNLVSLKNNDNKTYEDMNRVVNAANALVTESKFIFIYDEVWLIQEQFFIGDEDCYTLMEHILNNLSNSAEIFYNLL